MDEFEIKEGLNLDDYKNFKKGNLLILTDHRSSLGIPSGMWATRFDREISVDEAVEVHYANMKKDFPGLMENLTREQVRDMMPKMGDTRFFISTNGSVSALSSYERADIFDIKYLNGEGPRDVDFYLEKKKFCEEHNISIFSDAHYRVYPEMLNNNE